MPDSHSYPDALPPGHRIGNYEIRDVLGRGGFGITYQALQLRLNRTVAIKEYLPRYFAARAMDGNVHPISPEEADSYKWGLKRYLKEAQTLAQLDHPSIVRVHDYFEADGTGYIVMEYIEGKTLEAQLSKRLIPPHGGELKKILDPLMEGLEIVHGAGILHRDITPNNIMLRESGTPVLIDFGSARDMSSAHTQTMTLMGTPKYAAPEQMSGQGKQGTWTDIYGLSAVAYYCMILSPPKDIIDSVRFEHAATFFEFGRKIASRGLMAATERGLALRPQERPQTIAEWRTLAKEASQAIVDEYKHHAELGDANAQFRLGHMYSSGIDAPEDQQMAIEWYKLAAEQGHDAAQFRLGVLLYEDWKNNLEFKEDVHDEDDEYDYSGGRPSEKDIKKIRRMAKRGHPNSQLNMGFLHDYLYFQCIPMYDSDYDDIKYGSELLHLLLNSEDLSKESYVASETYGGSEVYDGNILYSDHYWDNEMHLETKIAIRWYRLAADQGVARAQYNLALKYLYGIGVDQSDERAEIWFHRAAEQGHSAAQAHLGFLRCREYMENDYTEAYLWCRLAAERRHTGACYLLGKMYHKFFEGSDEHPYEGESYMHQARYWYQAAAAEEHPGARFILRTDETFNPDYSVGYDMIDLEVETNEFIEWIANRCLDVIPLKRG